LFHHQNLLQSYLKYTHGPMQRHAAVIHTSEVPCHRPAAHLSHPPPPGRPSYDSSLLTSSVPRPVDELERLRWTATVLVTELVHRARVGSGKWVRWESTRWVGMLWTARRLKNQIAIGQVGSRCSKLATGLPYCGNSESTASSSLVTPVPPTDLPSVLIGVLLE
jgi:hypothetical protein